jgi:hypothetical protein
MDNTFPNGTEWSTTYGPWDPDWVPWETWHHGGWKGDFQVSYRKRENVDHMQKMYLHQTCRIQCPSGYISPHNEEWCEKWTKAVGISDPSDGNSSDPGKDFALGYHAISSRVVGGEVTDYPWTDRQFRSRVLLPTMFKKAGDFRSGYSEYLTNFGGVATPPTPKPGSKGAAGARELEVELLPTFCEGDRLSLTGSNKKYTATLDGQERPLGRAIVTSDIGKGFHFLEVTGPGPKTGETIRLQLPLSVIAPIELVAEPVTRITLQGESNGGIVKLQLRNRSRGDHAVRVEVAATPAGWMALRLTEPLVVLKPGDSADVDVQVERMLIADLGPEPLAFSVRATCSAKEVSDVTTTFYVMPREVRAGGRRRPPRPAMEIL